MKSLVLCIILSTAFVQGLDRSDGDRLLRSTDLASIWQSGNEDQDLIESRTSDVGDLDTRWQNDRQPYTKEQALLVSLAEMGLNQSQYLYDVVEPTIFLTGLTLNKNEPASYLAAFNRQSAKAKSLAKFGYASIHASSLISERFGLGRSEAAHLNEVSVQGTALYQQCPTKNRDKLRACPPISLYYRLADGSCNNPQSRFLGAAMTPFSRFLPAHYSDGVQRQRRSVWKQAELPSAREVSVTLHRDVNMTSTRVTMMVMQWGQFLDHDITSSAQSRGFNGTTPRCCLKGRRVPPSSSHPDCMPISIPAYDTFYARYNQTCMEFVRSSPAPRTDCSLGPREQINQITSFIDGTVVYGSSLGEMHRLRLFSDGMLKYTPLHLRKPLLPSGDERSNSECFQHSRNFQCFAAGDNRVNEQPGLASMHTVWMREHNRIARELLQLNTHWGDERVFQETRRIVGAMIQVITYNEWLPVVLGRSVIDIFGVTLQRYGFFYGYNSSVNPSIASSFATAAFRFGHSLVNSQLTRCDKHGNSMQLGISLHKEFMNPSQLYNIGSVDRLMFGMLYRPAQRRDVFISRELTNRLFQTTEPYGMDLASINIQRGRDHGLPGYMSWRRECGLKVFDNWAQMLNVMDDDSVGRLRIAYRHLDDIDLFAGGLAERPVKGGLVGPTFACIIGQQFLNLKTGDRFWFENGGMLSSFNPSQLHQLRKTTLARVLCDNLDDIDKVRPLVMRTGGVSSRNRPVACQLIRTVNLHPWREERPLPATSRNTSNSNTDSDFLFTPKNKPYSAITSLLEGHEGDGDESFLSDEGSQHTREENDLNEEDLQLIPEPDQPYIDELPSRLPQSDTLQRPLYNLLQLGQMLSRRPQ